MGIFILLVLSLIILLACVRMMLKSIFNYRALKYGEKYPLDVPRTYGMKINKRTKQVEGTSKQILPFE